MQFWHLTRRATHGSHDDVIKMEKCSALLALCAGNSPAPGEIPAQRPVTRSFDVFFELRLNKPLNKQSWGWWFETRPRSLWRHCIDLVDNGIEYRKQFQRTMCGLFPGLAFFAQHRPILPISFRVLLLRTGAIMRCKWSNHGLLFTKEAPSYWYRDSHCKPKTVVRPSQVYNGYTYTRTTASCTTMCKLYKGIPSGIYQLRLNTLVVT